MIESVVKEYAVLGNEYPKLMVAGGGLIVLFCGDEHGAVIEPNDIWECGYYSRDWNMDEFTDFNGTVTLSNGSK